MMAQMDNFLKSQFRRKVAFAILTNMKMAEIWKVETGNRFMKSAMFDIEEVEGKTMLFRIISAPSDYLGFVKFEFSFRNTEGWEKHLRVNLKPFSCYFIFF